MEALNAAGLTPLSVLRDRRRTKPRKNLTSPKISPLKSSSNGNSTTNPQNPQVGFCRSLHGGLVLLSSVLSSGFARALTYEEALQQSVTSSPSDSGFDLDIGGFFDGIINFGVEDPLVIAGGAAILGLPLVLSQVFSGKPKAYGVESAKTAYVKLGDDPNAQLVDIRATGEARQFGSPDLKGLKKKAVPVVYNGDDKVGFLNKLALKFKEPETTTLFILDKFDGNSELVAELVTANGFKNAYAIKDGADGPRGWVSSGLPWIQPKKSLSFDFASLTETIESAIDGSDALSLGLGIAAATGLGFVAFTEVETLLQLLGSAALVQVVTKKFLFAEERKQTLQQIDEFLTTKIAPKELASEFKEIGLALLPTRTTSKALPAPAVASPVVADEPVQKTEAVAEPAVQKVEAAPETALEKVEAVAESAAQKVEVAEPALEKVEAVAESAAQKVEEVAKPALEKVEAVAEAASQKVEEVAEPILEKVEAAAEAAPQVNSVPKTEVKAESLPGVSRPLSPYPYYPDFKPPTSPSPSPP